MTAIKKDQIVYSITTKITTGNSNVGNKHVRFFISESERVTEITNIIRRELHIKPLKDGSISTKDIATLFYNFKTSDNWKHLNLVLQRID